MGVPGCTPDEPGSRERSRDRSGDRSGCLGIALGDTCTFCKLCNRMETGKSTIYQPDVNITK